MCLEELSNPLLLSSPDAKDSKESDGFNCSCGNYVHFGSCSNVSFAKLGVNQLKALLCLKGCVSLQCPDCYDKTTTLASAVSAACDSKVAPLASNIAEVKSEIAELKASIKVLSDFITPSTGPSVVSGGGDSSDSYAARAKRGIPHMSPPACLSDAIYKANEIASARLRETELRNRTIIIEGLDTTQGLNSALGDLYNELDLQVKPDLSDFQEWKPKPRPGQEPMQTESTDDSATEPTRSTNSFPSLKLVFTSEYHAKQVVRASRLLKNSPTFGKTFIRPLRSAEENKLIGLRMKRAKLLASSDPDNAKFRIRYNRQGFPLLRVVNEAPQWDWVDTEWNSWYLLESNRAWAEQVEEASRLSNQ